MSEPLELLPPEPLDPTAPEFTPGRRIREARKARHISVRELSKRVNVSASFISQVELGRTTPSVGVLYNIASELELSLDSLMGEPRQSEQRTPSAAAIPGDPKLVNPSTGGSSLPNFQSASDRARISVGEVVWERLTSTDIDGMEFLHLKYPSGSESCRPDDLQRHNGWEFGHVLSGTLNVQVGFNSGSLGPGDSINFSSTIPHRLSNPGPDECTAIWVVVGRTQQSTNV